MTTHLTKLPSLRRLKVLAVSGLVLGAALAATPVTAETAEEKGFAIAARSDRSDRGFGDSEVKSKMILRNRAGAVSERKLFQKTLENPDEDYGDKTLIVFESPRDVDGTALLSHAKILDPDDQWLFLPALKRTKRISSVNKSGPFVGSEFAFEDFTSQELKKFKYTYLRSEPCGELTCDVVEQIPLYEFSGYTRQVSWIDQKVFQTRKTEFYDRKGALLKTLTFKDYKLYKDTYWRAHTLAMVNHQTGKSTDFVFSEYKFGVGLRGRDFVKGTLKRLR